MRGYVLHIVGDVTEAATDGRMRAPVLLGAPKLKHNSVVVRARPSVDAFLSAFCSLRPDPHVVFVPLFAL